LVAVEAFDTAPELQLELKIESLFKQQTEALNFVCRCQANINEAADDHQKMFWRNNLGESRAACCSATVAASVHLFDGKYAASDARLISTGFSRLVWCAHLPATAQAQLAHIQVRVISNSARAPSCTATVVRVRVSINDGMLSMGADGGGNIAVQTAIATSACTGLTSGGAAAATTTAWRTFIFKCVS